VSEGPFFHGTSPVQAGKFPRNYTLSQFPSPLTSNSATELHQRVVTKVFVWA
jgi:hypothetical protein